jgi:hypothetical protein
MTTTGSSPSGPEVEHVVPTAAQVVGHEQLEPAAGVVAPDRDPHAGDRHTPSVPSEGCSSSTAISS